MTDVMIDIEALGPKNCIVQIGACYFDRYTGEIGTTFKINIDAVSAVKAGAILDPDTVYWWLSQSKEAINSIIAEPRQDIHVAMNALNAFLAPCKAIWSHATYDFVIITNTYRMLHMKTSFQYKVCRDIRTLTDLAKITIDDTPRIGLHHDGLEDALHQVKYCVRAFNKLKSKESK